MPSIFDALFGRNQSIASPPIVPQQASMLNPMLNDTPSARDTLMGLAQGLIAAGAPSPYQTDFGTVFGKAIGGAASAAEGAQDKSLKRALVASQVQTAQDKIKQRQELSKLLLGAGDATPATTTTPQTAGATPAVAGPTGTLPPDWDQHYHKASADTGLSVDLLKAKDLAESSGNPNAVSPAGAAGPAGLMPGTAADLGVTNAKDPAQAIPAGAKYLAAQYAKYKDVDKALAAYNWGPGNVDNWIAAGADPAKLPQETQAYIAKIKAGLPAKPTFGSPAVAGLTPAVLGSAVAQPPSTIPQGDSPTPAPGPMAQAAPVAPPSPIPGPPTTGAPAGQNIKQVIQGLKPAERQLLGTMDPEDVTKFLLQRAAPNHETVLDTTDGTVKFVDKTDPLIGTRYQPVKAAELAVSMRNAAAQEKQATERARANDIRGANEPVIVGPNGETSPNPTLPGAKAAITGAEETAKVAPELLKYQGQEAIKDHQLSQQAAAKARASNNNLDHLSTLLDGINTGKMKGTTTELKAYAKGAGIDLDALGIKDDVAPIQAANKLLSQMALEARSTAEGGGMPGSMSDSDRQFLVGMTPGVETTPEGRKLIVDFMKNLNQRTLDAARIKNDYVRSGKFATDPAGMWAEIDKKYSPTLGDGKPNPNYVSLIDPSTKMPSANATPAPPAGFRIVQ